MQAGGRRFESAHLHQFRGQKSDSKESTSSRCQQASGIWFMTSGMHCSLKTAQRNSKELQFHYKLREYAFSLPERLFFPDGLFKQSVKSGLFNSPGRLLEVTLWKPANANRLEASRARRQGFCPPQAYRVYVEEAGSRSNKAMRSLSTVCIEGQVTKGVR